MAYEFTNFNDIVNNQYWSYIRKDYTIFEGSSYPLTINIWLMITSVPTSLLYVCGLGNERDPSQHYISINPQRRCRGTTVDADGSITTISSPGTAVVNTNQWAMATYVISSSNNRELYLNGKQVGTSTTTRPQSNLSTLAVNGIFSEAVFIGSPEVGNPVRYAEFALWQNALSGSEINSLYKGIKAAIINPQDLVSYIPMIGGEDIKTIKDLVDGEPIHISTDGEEIVVGGVGQFIYGNTPTKFSHPRRYG